MSSYSNIVFGLKHSHSIFDCRTFMELRQSLCIIIYKHNIGIYSCERPGLHYHGIIEHDPDTSINNMNAIIQLKTYCTYFKLETCTSPEQFLLAMAQQHTEVMIIEIANSLNLTTLYNTIPHSLHYQLKLTEFEENYSKMFDVKLIMFEILNRRLFDSAEIYNKVQKQDIYYSTPDEMKHLINASISLVRQKVLDQSILELCNCFSKCPEKYYTLQESIDVVMEWCLHQNLDIGTFTMNWIYCLDKQVSHKNCLYFQGSPDSGVMSIIRSIVDACTFIGKVENEITGFTYVWKDCVEKRCIIMQDPVFDENMFEELESILKGVGTIVPYELNIMKYIRPTPVIILNMNNNRECDLFLERLQPSFIHSYVNLKPFLKLHSDSRLLDPGWLNVLHKHLIQKFDLSEKSASTLRNSMESEPSSPLTDDLISPIPSVSSTTPYIGTPNSGYCEDS